MWATGSLAEMPKSFRTRLTSTIIVLITVTAGFMAVFAYLLVRDSLRDRLVDDGVARSRFNIGVLASEEQLPADSGIEEFEASPLANRLLLSGIDGFYIELGSGEIVASSLALGGTGEVLSEELREIVGLGEFGYEFLEIDDAPILIVGARRPPAGPDFYFFFDAGSVEEALSQLRRVLIIAGVVVVLVGTVAAGLISRGVLRPVAVASRAAETIADGNLDVRLPVESKDELGRWAEAFNRMAASLQDKIDALVSAQERERRFVADVSHELRTPITALVNEAALLEQHMDALPESGRHLGDLLIADVARLRWLVENLLELSRLEAGSSTNLSPVEIEPFLRAVISERHPEARLQVLAIDEPITVDRWALEGIVANLLDNAKNHASGANTAVSAFLESGTLNLTVGDDGPGVTDDELNHLFDRFYKTDDARQGGSGLGLAIARQYARQMGGDLTVRRGEQSGLVFEAVLPVAELLRAGDGRATLATDPEE